MRASESVYVHVCGMSVRCAWKCVFSVCVLCVCMRMGVRCMFVSLCDSMDAYVYQLVCVSMYVVESRREGNVNESYALKTCDSLNYLKVPNFTKYFFKKIKSNILEGIINCMFTIFSFTHIFFHVDVSSTFHQQLCNFHMSIGSCTMKRCL